jgi:hypothetical protein
MSQPIETPCPQLAPSTHGIHCFLLCQQKQSRKFILYSLTYRKRPPTDRMSKVWKLSHQGSDLPPLDRLVGGPETFKKDLEERNERQLEDAKRSFWGKDAERLFLQRSESSSQHPPGLAAHLSLRRCMCFSRLACQSRGPYCLFLPTVTG